MNAPTPPPWLVISTIIFVTSVVFSAAMGHMPGWVTVPMFVNDFACGSGWGVYLFRGRSSKARR